MARRLIHYPWIINSILLNAWKQWWGGGIKITRSSRAADSFRGKAGRRHISLVQAEICLKEAGEHFSWRTAPLFAWAPFIILSLLICRWEYLFFYFREKGKKKKRKKKPLFRSESLHHRQALLNCWQEEEERKNDINAMQRLSQQRYTKKKKKRKNHSAPINCRSGGIRCWCRATRLEPSTCTHMHTHSLSPLFPLPLTLCWSCEKLLWVTGSSGGDKIN